MPSKTSIALLCALVSASGIGVIGWAAAPGPVTLQVSADRRALAPGTILTITGAEPRRGATELAIELLQGELTRPLATVTGAPRSVFGATGAAPALTASITLDAAAMQGLVDGVAKVRVTAQRAKTWGIAVAPTVQRFEVPVDRSPPALRIQRPVEAGVQGGAAAIVYAVGPDAVRHGVRAGAWWFPGHRLPGAGGSAVCLFGLPHDVGEADAIQLVAEDDLGNQRAVGALSGFISRAQTTDEINVSDRFLELIVPRIRGKVPGIGKNRSLLEDYVTINSELRRINAATLRALGEASEPSKRWRGRFEPMEKAQIYGRFADHRSYLYEGRLVDRQWHLGFDLASVMRAPVPAANGGRVVFASYLGIYGNAVVLDHGFGLTTIYAHLSSIDVLVGEQVRRGQRIGRTGATGLASGDHLHFEVRIRGLAVRPSQWWDATWVARNIDAAFEGG